jgi:hypothetical protein
MDEGDRWKHIIYLASYDKDHCLITSCSSKTVPIKTRSDVAIELLVQNMTKIKEKSLDIKQLNLAFDQCIQGLEHSHIKNLPTTFYMSSFIT